MTTVEEAEFQKDYYCLVFGFSTENVQSMYLMKRKMKMSPPLRPFLIEGVLGYRSCYSLLAQKKCMSYSTTL